MYKIMIIDDDIPVLEYLKNFIDWDDLGITIVHKTSSSIEALESLDKVKPDIILTDIGMPEVDGLELAMIALEKNKYTRIIFLTSHEDFNFAKQALQLKADDYLLKDQLTPDQLESSLMKAISHIKQQQVHEQLFLENTKISNKHILRQIFMSELVNKQDVTVLRKSISRFNKSWKHSDYRIVIGHLPLNQENIHVNYTISMEKFYHLLSHYFNDHNEIEVFFNDDKVMILINYQASIKFNVQEYLNECLQKASVLCKEELKVDVMFVPLLVKIQLENLSETYEKIIQERYRIFYQSYKLINELKLKDEYSFIPLGNLLEFIKRELRKAIKIGEIEELDQIMTQMKETLYLNQVDPKDLMRELIHFISLIEVRTRHFEHNDLFGRKLQSAWLLEEIIDIFKFKVKELAQQNQPELPTTTDAQTIQKVDNYIMENLGKKISAVDMANYLFLNPSYFSRYFKRITGSTFTDYVHQYKMTAAARYLLNTEKTIESIGEKLGFYERTYFSKVFKKYIGKSPSEYRNSHKII